MNKKNIKTYSSLSRLNSFEERFEYCRLKGLVGDVTFGGHRWLNQEFYRSKDWKHIRSEVIIRDNGCDLGVLGREIFDKVIIHHLNPISLKDLEDESPLVFDPEYLITVSYNTHNAIHYGDANLLLPSKFVERKPNDTCPWR